MESVSVKLPFRTSNEGILERAQGVILGGVFFLLFFGLSAWLPFFNLYLKEVKGFSGSQVGVIAGAYQAVLFFVVPLWGILADRYGNRRVLRTVLLCAAALLAGLRLISTYHALILYVFCFAAVQHPIGSLTDSLAIGYVQRRPRAAFGQFRVWASVGWALGNIVVGQYLQNRPLSRIFGIGASFYALSLLLLLLFRESQPAPASRSTRELPRLVADPLLGPFLLLLLLYGIAISPLYVFINLYYHDIGADNRLIGLAFALQALSEVPFFFLGRRLLRRFGSGPLLLFSMGTAVLRMLLYGLIDNPVQALFVGLGSGITYSLFWIAIVDRMHALVPEKWRSTAQSLLWAFHVGCGVTIGNMTIGLLSDHFHMQTVMLMAAAMTAAVLLAAFVYLQRTRTAPVVLDEITELPPVSAAE